MDRTLPRPVVVGFGPCGMFAGLLLAQMGFKPIVLERGNEVRQRTKDTWGLWRKSMLTPESNVQFGEGGAGLFSDGKLYSQIKDPKFYGRKVLHEFVKAGAPEEILYVSKPHIGTFRLTGVVENMREQIIALGGEVRFEQRVTDVLIDDGQLVGVQLNGGETAAVETRGAGPRPQRPRHLPHAPRPWRVHGSQAVLGGFPHRAPAVADRPRAPGQVRRPPETWGRRLQTGAPRQERTFGLQLLHVPGRHRGRGDVRTESRRHQRHEPVLA